ncbi:MAG TPA: endonuclease III [Syntrophobacteria bacterium]|nr:endonuclease III [Syntrophobacteria bacterium]
MKDMAAIFAILEKTYPDAKCSLDFTNPLELLVATVLSAQCTDERVNQVTKSLFTKYRSARDYASAPIHALEEDIRPTGFFRNKAKSLKSCGISLVDRFRGQVPRTLDELVTLPGIGRKTANVILGAAFDTPGIVVDTHVSRIAQRLGLTRHQDPVKIEFDLMEIVPRSRWTQFSHQIIWHGRRICTARNPKCPQCPLLAHCDYGQQALGTKAGGDSVTRKGKSAAKSQPAGARRKGGGRE